MSAFPQNKGNLIINPGLVKLWYIHTIQLKLKFPCDIQNILSERRCRIVYIVSHLLSKKLEKLKTHLNTHTHFLIEKEYTIFFQLVP